jgi:hypothetical protein
MKACALSVLLAAALAAVALQAADFTGTFLNDDEGLELVLEAKADGTLVGHMSADDDQRLVSGTAIEDAFVGRIFLNHGPIPLIGRMRGDALELVMGPLDEPMRIWNLRRASTSDAAQGPATSGSSPVAAGIRNVVINGIALPLETLNALERQYRIRIEDADYWYDPLCGAWGLRGGPTLGFIPAGMKLGGPLAADASGKGTGVFLNGREAHAQDVLALQSILGPVMPGRYFVDAQGNAGYEGGIPLVNLVVAARQAAQQRGGGAGNWSSRLLDAGGAWDGNGSGYVMGRDASGKSWSASY